jgi:hypothetical protein
MMRRGEVGVSLKYLSRPPGSVSERIGLHIKFTKCCKRPRCHSGKQCVNLRTPGR